MLARRHPTTHSILLLLAALVLGACNNNANEPNVASGVSVVSGDGQFATAGSATANPLVVLVVDQNGQPFSNAPVTWHVTGGGGTLADSTSTSDDHGHASMMYTAGANTGTATVLATAAQLWTAKFTIHVVAP